MQLGASPLVENGAQRKLATILAADVVGYSRLTAADEEGTHARFKASLTEVIDPTIAKYQGRVIKNTGDGFLAEFASAVNCVACAVEIQRRLGRRNQDVVADRRLEFRFGINIGDVIADGGDVYGGGVNVAVRLEGMCDPGGILVSDDAYRQVHDKLEIEFQDRGPQNLKNIEVPVRAYAVEMGSVAGTAPVTSGGQHPQRMGLAIAAVVIAAVIGAIAWQATQPPTVEAAVVADMAFALPDKPSIAVLAFENLSTADDELLADSFSEDILASLSKLSKLSGLFVISRTTSFTYKGKDASVKQIAEDLGVRYVWEGSVQRDGDRLRVTAQLIDAIGGQHVWADRYDRDLNDLFAVKDDITLNIVSNISAELLEGERNRISRRETNSLEAWLLYRQGRDEILKFERESLMLARDLLERALDIDPGFVSALGFLGNTYRLEGRFGHTATPEASYETALEIFDRALAMDPDHPYTNSIKAAFLFDAGKIDLALEFAHRAVDLDPNDYITRAHLARALHLGGDPADSSGKAAWRSD